MHYTHLLMMDIGDPSEALDSVHSDKESALERAKERMENRYALGYSIYEFPDLFNAVVTFHRE